MVGPTELGLACCAYFPGLSLRIALSEWFLLVNSRQMT